VEDILGQIVCGIIVKGDLWLGWIQLAEDGFRWRAVMCTAMYLCVE